MVTLVGELVRDHEKSALMKDLHDLSMRHGVTMVVYTEPMDGRGIRHTFLIDHKEHTPTEDVVVKFGVAGMHLIQVAGKVHEYAKDEDSKEPAPVESP